MLLLLQLLVCALASLGVDVLLLFFSVQEEVRSPQQVRDVRARRGFKQAVQLCSSGNNVVFEVASHFAIAVSLGPEPL